MKGLLLGVPCIIAEQIKIQKKTSKYKIINWIYGRIYGYDYESTLPPGVDMIYFDGKYIFRDEETLNKVMKIIDLKTNEFKYE